MLHASHTQTGGVIAVLAQLDNFIPLLTINLTFFFIISLNLLSNFSAQAVKGFLEFFNLFFKQKCEMFHCVGLIVAGTQVE
jgi:hypothetical protein